METEEEKKTTVKTDASGAAEEAAGAAAGASEETAGPVEETAGAAKEAEEPPCNETGKAARKKDGGTRERQIIRVSFVGIAANLLLSGFKAAVGLVTGAISILLDAVNNLSDALSSVITIVGTKISSKKPDRKHPYGHGRVEYLTATVISVLVLYAGISSLTGSIDRIVHPSDPEYSAVPLIIVGVAVAVKLVLGIFVKRAGTRLQSDALRGSGQDAFLDAVISASTLAAAAVFLIWHVNLEAWLALVISLVIIRSGLGMLWGTVSKLLGERVEGDLAKAVKETVESTEGVLGAYDLVLNNYGPDRWIGSIHIEVPDDWTADRIDTVSRKIANEVYLKDHVVMTAVGVYSHNSGDSEAAEIRTNVTRAAMGTGHVIQMHGFYCDTGRKSLRFDVVVSFTAPDQAAVAEEVRRKVAELYPDYDVFVQQDSDFAD